MGGFFIMKQSRNYSATLRTRNLELGAVLLTALGKFVVMDWLNWRFIYVALAVIFWSVYVLKTYKKNPQALIRWGFTTHNFKTVAHKVLPFGIVAVGLFLILGTLRGTITLTWHIVPILITYPIWGVIQQYLVIALVGGNLQAGVTTSWQKWGAILITALLFSGVHYPNLWLMAGTFILGIFYGVLYLKHRNLYVFGLFHGWLGALFYYTVVGSDPFADIFPLWA